MTPATMFIAQPVHPTMNDQLNFEVCRKLSVGTPDLPVNIANASKLNRADTNAMTPGNLNTKSRRKKDAMTKTKTTAVAIIASAMKARTERIQARTKNNKVIMHLAEIYA